jgi:hypothetical protein
MKVWKRWIGGLLALLLVFLVLPSIAALVYLRSASPRDYRFPFPSGTQLDEQAALELSKAALVLDGREATVLRPVLSGHTDSLHREVYFARNVTIPDRGWVLWSCGPSGRVWDYKVNVERSGEEVVCQVVTPK